MAIIGVPFSVFYIQTEYSDSTGGFFFAAAFRDICCAFYCGCSFCDYFNPQSATSEKTEHKPCFTQHATPIIVLFAALYCLECIPNRITHDATKIVSSLDSEEKINKS